MRQGESVMFTNAPAGSDREKRGPRGRFVSKVVGSIRDSARIGIYVGLLTCLGSEGVIASPPTHQPGEIGHRTIRIAPRRFVISPDGPTVAVNQFQRFTVTDAEGRIVAVHWNLAGLGCSGATCGTIDERGIYRTPTSTPRPRVVTLEGVVVSDPTVSVLTEIRIVDAGTTAVRPGSDPPSLSKPQQLIPPVLGRQDIASRVHLPPLPSGVAPAPIVEGGRTIPRFELPRPAPIVAAAPVLVRATIPGNAGVLPLPRAVAPTPVVETKRAVQSIEFLRAPDAIAPAPALEKSIIARRAGVLPLPRAVVPLSVSSLVLIGETKQVSSSPHAGTPETSAAPVLPAMPDQNGAATVEPVVAAQHAPTVTYQDGQLSIDAQNSTLAEVLKLVADKTGATIDVPPGTGLEHIVEHTGPAPVKDVLWGLLNGSPFNFIIVSSPQPPHDLAQVLLSLQTVNPDTANGAPTTSKLVAAAPAWTPPQTPTIEILPPRYDTTLTAPKEAEALSPEARGELMKEKAREIRERAQQQYPQQ